MGAVSANAAKLCTDVVRILALRVKFRSIPIARKGAFTGRGVYIRFAGQNVTGRRPFLRISTRNGVQLFGIGTRLREISQVTIESRQGAQYVVVMRMLVMRVL